jgi:hypothetical protein
MVLEQVSSHILLENFVFFHAERAQKEGFFPFRYFSFLISMLISCPSCALFFGCRFSVSEMNKKYKQLI